MNREITGRTVLLWLAPFFGVILLANAWFVTLSMRTFHGEDRQRPYQQGLEYNETLAERARQQAAGWKVEMEVHNTPAGLTVRLAVRKRDGSPVDGLKLNGILRHPADTFQDTSFPLTQTAPGIYNGRIQNFERGRRDVVIRAVNNVSFEVERRVWLP